MLFSKFVLKSYQSDLILADQITFHLPLLKILSPVLFYCHFPDKFLAPKSDGVLGRNRNLYRKVLDWAEEFCLLNGAKEIVVNSRFTQEKFKEAFKTIKTVPKILYPGVEVCEYSEEEEDGRDEKIKIILLSLNRFERKKDLHLAIESFQMYKEQQRGSNDLKLFLAGGYDPRVLENREHLKELKVLCDKFNLKNLTLFRNEYENDFSKIDLEQIQVLFLPSISQETKRRLLKMSTGLLYTPSNEHFGIVPIEAMSNGLPVIAMNSGGPKETVLDGVTGYLCDPCSKSIAEAIGCLLNNDKDGMGEAGRIRVKEMFSLKVFGDQLNSIVKDTATKKIKSK